MSYPPPPQQPWQPQQYPPPWPQQAGPPPPGPPPRRPGRRHPVLGGIAIGAGVLLALVIVVTAAGGGRQAAPAASTTASAAPAAATSAAAAKPVITYVVTGTPGGADVTYGPAGSDLSGRVPMRVTKRLGHAAFYSIQAQLNGGGKVTVEIAVGGKVISKGTATGGYNIASAEIEQDMFTGNWEDVQS